MIRCKASLIADAFGPFNSSLAGWAQAIDSEQKRTTGIAAFRIMESPDAVTHHPRVQPGKPRPHRGAGWL